MKISSLFKKTVKSLHFLFLIVLISSFLDCSTVKNSMNGQVVDKTPTVSFRIGPSSGGLIENNKMSEINGVSDVDAITGATKTSMNFGIHTQVSLKGHLLETGLDYIQFRQSVTYEMPSLGVNGKRDFRFHQLRVPITYNFHFFKNKNNDPIFILRPGLSIGYTFSKSISSSGNTPDYKFTDWNIGPTLGVSVLPFQYRHMFRIGAYLDVFRGGKLYEDSYHKAEEVGGQSYWMFGITLQPVQ